MQYIFLPALFVLTALTDHAYACSMAFMHTLPPNADAVRISGVIAGYGAARPVGHLVPAPTVRVRIQEAVGGTMPEGDAEVALLGYGPDCESTPYERQTLERAFPIGMRVVVFGAARVRDAGTAVVVAEENRSQYVVRIPPSVPRTSYGDIDFQRANGNGPFLDFEFDRIVLTLLKNPVKDRVPRLKNLAYYFADPYLYMPTAPEVSR
jgi:hypothetical protein